LYTHVFSNTVHNSQIIEPHRCPSTDEWINKMYIYTMEYYSYCTNGTHPINKKEIMLFIGKWMELEIMMLSKVRQIDGDR
jgi:hypothetical protein